MAKTETDLNDAAQALLDEAEGDNGGALPGLSADTKVSVLGVQFATSENLVLGERIELRVVTTVNFVGDQLIENEGKRHVVKLQSDLIEIVKVG